VETLYGVGELINVDDGHVMVELKYGTVFCNEDMIFDVGVTLSKFTHQNIRFYDF
jgi:hypothetical protein